MFNPILPSFLDIYIRDLTVESYVVKKRGEVPSPIPEKTPKEKHKDLIYKKEIYQKYGYCLCQLKK